MAVTIKDVARQAEVSVATVSRALNGHSNVRSHLREHVQAVAHYFSHSARKEVMPPITCH